jgi:hypothetical protein
LTPLGRDVLVSQVNSPFALLRLSPSGDSVRVPGVLDQAKGERPREMRASNGVWAAVPVIPLDRFFLQTITNLRGDRRVLVLFDPSARRAIRTRAIDAPVTFFGASNATGELFALRQLGRNEIVTYRWRLSAH